MPHSPSPDSDRLHVILSKDLKEKIRMLAAQDKRTMSQWVMIQLESIAESRTKSA